MKNIKEVPKELAEECKKVEGYKCQFCDLRPYNKKNIKEYVNVIDIGEFTLLSHKSENSKTFSGLDRLFVVCPRCEFEIKNGAIKFHDNAKRFIVFKSDGKEQGTERYEIGIRNRHLDWTWWFIDEVKFYSYVDMVAHRPYDPLMDAVRVSLNNGQM